MKELILQGETLEQKYSFNEAWVNKTPRAELKGLLFI